MYELQNISPNPKECYAELQRATKKNEIRIRGVYSILLHQLPISGFARIEQRAFHNQSNIHWFTEYIIKNVCLLFESTNIFGRHECNFNFSLKSTLLAICQFLLMFCCGIPYVSYHIMGCKR